MSLIRRQQERPDLIFKVDLDDTSHTYGRVIDDANYAFYDCLRQGQIKDLDRVVTSPILFITAVYRYAIRKGRWQVVGHRPLEAKRGGPGSLDSLSRI